MGWRYSWMALNLEPLILLLCFLCLLHACIFPCMQLQGLQKRLSGINGMEQNSGMEYWKLALTCILLVLGVFLPSRILCESAIHYRLFSYNLGHDIKLWWISDFIHLSTLQVHNNIHSLSYFHCGAVAQNTPIRQIKDNCTILFHYSIPPWLDDHADNNHTVRFLWNSVLS